MRECKAAGQHLVSGCVIVHYRISRFGNLPPLDPGFFQVSPEGNLVCSRYKDHEETFFDFIHQCVLSNFMDMILRGILWPPHRKCVQLNGQGKLFQFEQGEDKERAAAVGTE